MTSDLILGFALILLGAICGGSFGLPSKFAPQDTPWENLWGPFFFFATILIPVVLGPVVVKDFYQSFSGVSWSVMIPPIIFGFLWGLGSMTLGLSFAFIGLSLAYAINYGAQIAFGAIAPMLLRRPEQILMPHGLVVLAGVAVCLLGVVVSGRAGILKTRSLEADSSQQPNSEKSGWESKILFGLVLAFVSGLLCACYAVAVDFGNDLKANPFVVMSLILWSGAVSSCSYCVFQLCKNKTWGHFAKPGLGRILLLAAIMACLHDGAILSFGKAVGYLGLEIGVSVGYAVFMSFAIIVGNVNGFITGEWKGASRLSVRWIVAGIAVLIVGVCILAQANLMALSASK